MRQRDIAAGLRADKSVVSRWFSGTMPTAEWLDRLADFFGVPPHALIRHPREEWMRAFLDGRSDEEIDRIKSTLEAAFPRPGKDQ